MTIKVCVGSSCHLKGSYDVIEAFKEVLKKYDVEDLIDLQASFCLGHCATGVTVECDDLEPAERGAVGGVQLSGQKMGGQQSHPRGDLRRFPCDQHLHVGGASLPAAGGGFGFFHAGQLADRYPKAEAADHPRVRGLVRL